MQNTRPGWRAFSPRPGHHTPVGPTGFDGDYAEDRVIRAADGRWPLYKTDQTINVANVVDIHDEVALAA
jgi:hypothetical protein